jgi:predicted Zn-dependent peptidase
MRSIRSIAGLPCPSAVDKAITVAVIIKDGTEAFSDDDIVASVKSLEDGFRSVSDSAESVANWFTTQVCSKEFLYPEDFIEQFKKVTREDIIEAAKSVTLDTVFMLEGTEDEEEACE